jgi:hypothetical protein
MRIADMRMQPRRAVLGSHDRAAETGAYLMSVLLDGRARRLVRRFVPGSLSAVSEAPSAIVDE